MIYKKKNKYLNEDFDFNKVKKATNDNDDYKISFYSIELCYLLIYDNKIDIDKFFKKLGKNKCKEYIEKYLNLLGSNFFNDTINENFCYNKIYYKWINNNQYLHIEIAPDILKLISNEKEKELLENDDIDFIVFLSIISTCERYLIFEGVYNDDYYDYILDRIQIDNYIYEMYDDDTYYINKFNLDLDILNYIFCGLVEHLEKTNQIDVDEIHDNSIKFDYTHKKFIFN